MAAIKILTLIRLGCHILNGSSSPLFFLKRIGNGFFFQTIVYFKLALNSELLMYPSSSNSSLFCDAYQRGLGLTKGRQSHSQPSGSCETGPSLPPPLPGYYGYPAMGGEGWYSWASPPPGRPASQWGPLVYQWGPPASQWSPPPSPTCPTSSPAALPLLPSVAERKDRETPAMT